MANLDRYGDSYPMEQYMASDLRKRQRGKMASMKFSKLQPWSEWGAARIERGTPWSTATFGTSARSATAAQKAVRRMSGFTGRGMYTSGKAVSVSGSGKYNIWNALTGKSNKRLLSGALKAYTGRGAYSNNLVTGGGLEVGKSPATYVSTPDETGTVTVTHKEYLTDVYGPNYGVSFFNTPFNLNAGLQGTFPFLSQIAANYDEYEFVQLLFEYRSTVTDIGSSTSGQCGTVIMCTNYNSSSPLFTDKAQMMEYAHAHSCKTTEDMVHGVECDPAKLSNGGSLFTRSNPLTGTQDLKTYDLGIFQFALANLPNNFTNQAIGELWVSYSCRLRKPKLFVSRGLSIDQDLFMSPTPYTVVSGGSTYILPFPNSTFYSGQNNNIGCLFEPGVSYAYSGGTSPFQQRTSPSVVTTAGVQYGVCSFTFPANVSGLYRITFTHLYDVPGSSSFSKGKFHGLNVLGNISLASDLGYSSWAGIGSTASVVGTTVSALVSSAPVDVSNTTTHSSDVCENNIVICDVFVRPAIGIQYVQGATNQYTGGDNILCFTWSMPSANCVMTGLQARVEQIGSGNLLPNASSRLTWLKQDGTSTTAP